MSKYRRKSDGVVFEAQPTGWATTAYGNVSLYNSVEFEEQFEPIPDSGSECSDGLKRAVLALLMSLDARDSAIEKFWVENPGRYIRSCDEKKGHEYDQA